MATQTRTLGSLFDGAGNAAVLSYDYDDATLRVSRIRCVNGLSVPVFASLTRLSDGRMYGPATCAAETTITPAIPAGAANRLPLTLLAKGTLDGADVQFWT